MLSLTARHTDPVFFYVYITQLSMSPYSIDAGQLHADVDDHHAEHLPTDRVVQEQLTHWYRIHRRQRALLFLHLLNLSLDVTLGSVPLQGWETGDRKQHGHSTSWIKIEEHIWITWVITAITSWCIVLGKYLSFISNISVKEDMIQGCHSAINEWISQNVLLLNCDKTNYF